MPARTRWTAVHALYPSVAARFRLVVELLSVPEQLGLPHDACFFVDMPVMTSSGTRDGLELGYASERRSPGVLEALGAALERARAAGLVVATSVAGPPQALAPTIFEQGIVPSFYPRALVLGSVRAARILQSVPSLPEPGHTGTAGVPPAVVREELDCTYRALIPHRVQRRSAMLDHAAWVEGVAQQGGSTTTPQHEFGNAPPLPSTNAYAAMRPLMRRQILRIATRMDQSRPSATALGLQTAMIARLAHIQVVRLWGPAYEGSLLQEAALLRDLA
jgi:hypothetical protein